MVVFYPRLFKSCLHRFFRAQLTESGLAELLTYIQNTSMDRDTWNMAEQALLNLQVGIVDFVNEISTSV